MSQVRPPRSLRKALLAAVLGVAVTAAWAPALTGGFVWDDKTDLVLSDRLRHSSSFVDVFRHQSMWAAGAPEGSVATYRPVALASLALDYQLWGLYPFGFHATSLVLHVLATLAVFLALGKLVGDDRVAAALALLGALHPANAEAVAWINGRSEVLALLFGALALAAAASRRWLALAAALFVAMLSKETGAIFVPLAALVGCIDASGRRVRVTWQPPVAAAVALLAYGALRSAALGPSVVPAGSLVTALQALPALWMRAVQEALLPFERGLVTVSDWLARVSTAESLGYAGATLALLAIGVALVVRRQLFAALGLAWWLGALVPLTAIVILDYPWPGLARWLYIGLPGLLLFVWLAAVRHLPPRARTVLFVVVGIAWLVLAERAIPVWHDDTALYSAMIEDSPDDAWAWRALGRDQLAQGNFAKAAELFHGAIERDHTEEIHQTYGLEALAWTHLGRCDEAVAQYRDHPPTHAVEPDRFVDAAATCYARAGDLGRARQLWTICARARRSCAESLAKLDKLDGGR